MTATLPKLNFKKYILNNSKLKDIQRYIHSDYPDILMELINQSQTLIHKEKIYAYETPTKESHTIYALDMESLLREPTHNNVRSNIWTPTIIINKQKTIWLNTNGHSRFWD